MKKLKILLVDDNAEWREPMKEMLESSKLLVKTAPDGDECVELAKSWQPNLIVLDNKMPNMTGPEAAKQLRKYPSTKNIPIIMVSAMDIQQSTIEYIKLDVDNFLKKPFTTDMLLRQIEKMTGLPVEKKDYFKLDSVNKPKVIVALHKTESITRINHVLGEVANIIEVSDSGKLVEQLKKIPDLVFVNYKTAGFGAKGGINFLYNSLTKQIPVVLDMADILKPEAEKKLLEKGRRYHLLEPLRNEQLDKKINDLLGVLEFS